MAAERVKKLKDLIDVVMRLPESPERDRLLSEVRSRAVDLDTGVAPRAMLPLREPVPLSLAAKPPKRRTVAPPRTPPLAQPTALLSSTGELDWDKALSGAALLSLEDSPECWPSLHEDGSGARPWTLGLRG